MEWPYPVRFQAANAARLAIRVAWDASAVAMDAWCQGRHAARRFDVAHNSNAMRLVTAVWLEPVTLVLPLRSL